MRVLIGGATGFIGRAITKQLQNKNHEVIELSRTSGPSKMTWNDLIEGGLPDCAAVVSLSGENILNPMKRWTENLKQEVWRSRAETTKLLANAINQASKKPRVFVTMSGVGYYPPSTTEEYTEDSKVGTSTEEYTEHCIVGDNHAYLTSLCTEWEDSGRLATDVRHVIIRSGVVLGKTGGAIKQMWPFWFCLGGKLGSGTQYFPWIHIDDIAGLFVHAIESDSTNGVLNGVAPDIVTNKQFTVALASQLRRPAIIPWPTWAINLVYGTQRGSMLLEGQKVIPKRTMESGYVYKYAEVQHALKSIV